MLRKISASALVCALFAISMTAYAQGRPAGAGNKGGGRPSVSQQQDRSASMRQKAEARRQKAEEKRLAAESAHAEAPPADAVDKRAAGEDHNISADMREAHPPNPNAAEEAFLGKGNADNKTLHGERRNVTGVVQRETRGDDGDEANPD